MEKHLLIFGANGALGQGVTETLLQKDYEKIYLFGSHKIEIPGFEGSNKKEALLTKGETDTTKIIQIQTGNLSDEAEVVRAFENVKPSRGILYFLFSTVGGFTGGKKIWESDIKDLESMISGNLKTNYLIGKYFSRLVKESAGGSILFTSAMTGLNPEKGKIPYGISKSSLIYMVESLALEGAEIKLTVNAIAPYIIDTPANRSWMGDSYDYESLIKPKEVGDLVHSVFQNFRFVSGNVIRLPGRVVGIMQ
jgi:NAD(P)-dependent dehydrogenase (short-subunit alcohol dehydrogenase family)